MYFIYKIHDKIHDKIFAKRHEEAIKKAQNPLVLSLLGS